MDLVCGQRPLQPTTTDSLVPNALWLLITVHEFSGYKLAWPIYSKKTVPTQIRYFLENPKTKFGITPKRLQTDSGSEFSNEELQEELNSCDI